MAFGSERKSGQGRLELGLPRRDWRPVARAENLRALAGANGALGFGSFVSFMAQRAHGAQLSVFC